MLCWTSVKYSSSFQIDKEVEKLLELKALKIDSSEAPAGKWVLKCPKVADQVLVCVCLCVCVCVCVCVCLCVCV